MDSFKLRIEIRWAMRWGFILCIAQILFCLIFSSLKNGAGLPQYFNLLQWDSFHYLDIVEKGYHLPSGALTAEDVHTNRANVGYFPAFPLASMAIHKAFGISSTLSLLLTAQIFAFLFWMQLLLLLRLLQVSSKRSLFAAFTIAIYPASFFLVAGYSESLFLSSLVGYLFWILYDQRKEAEFRVGLGFCLAAIWGVLLSSSRLVGIPLVIYPIVQLLGQKGFKLTWALLKSRSFVLSIFLSCIGGLGALLFFGLCKYWFGEWNIYLKLQQLGWGNKPNYLGILDPRSYVPQFFFEDTVNSVSRASNLFIATLFILSFRFEVLNHFRNLGTRFGFYFCAASMFFNSVSGKANYGMDSMVRYNLPVFTILVIVMTHQIVQTSQQGSMIEFFKGNRKLLILGYLIAWVVQAWMIHLFTKGGWVA